MNIENLNKVIYLLIKGEITKLTVGRDPSCEIEIPQDKTEISRFHCEISTNNDGSFILKDISTNGTFVNKKKIHRTSIKIGLTDEFIIGQYRFTLNGQFQDLSKEAAVKSFGIEKIYNNEFANDLCVLTLPTVAE